MSIKKWFPCCSSTADLCDWCSGTVQDEIQINVGNVGDNDCDECDPALVDSFVLEKVGACTYFFSIDPFTCVNIGCGGADRHVVKFTAQHTKVGANYIFRVRAWECECNSINTDTCLGAALWEKNFGITKPNCTFTSTPLDIPLVSGDTDMCDWSAATLTVEVI